ncbi:glucokinase [Vulcanococcus limneticus]|uniref:glucokinase n=1 Tax=Vulcanococcus limneticus TaxID=2170428 RepID=UPI00398C1EF1
MTTLLAGDIGGTKTLLATYRLEDSALIQQRAERFPSAEWADFAALVNHFLAGGAAGEPPRQGPPLQEPPAAACFAVAGPVRHGRVKLTNLPWELEEATLAGACGLERLELVNDFAVLIYGLPHLSPLQQVPLDPANPASDPGAPLAILGAGTGLGVAIGVPTAAGLVAVASEGAHAAFAPRTPEEWALQQWLQADRGLERVSIERIVSGTGLGEVMRWVLAGDDPDGQHALAAAARAWRHPETAAAGPAPAAPPDLPALTAQAAAAGDPLAGRALGLWLGAYGSVAGDLALHSLCLGGLWVGGGTAAKLLDGLRSPAFLAPLRAKGRLSPVLAQVPVTALTDPEAGLFSAACRARMLLAA